MRPGRQDLNINFFTFRSCHQLDGRQAPCRPPIFENFPIRHIFLKFCFFKYKNEKSVAKTRQIKSRSLKEKRRSNQRKGRPSARPVRETGNQEPCGIGHGRSAGAHERTRPSVRKSFSPFGEAPTMPAADEWWSMSL